MRRPNARRRLLVTRSRRPTTSGTIWRRTSRSHTSRDRTSSPPKEYIVLLCREAAKSTPPLLFNIISTNYTSVQIQFNERMESVCNAKTKWRPRKMSVNSIQSASVCIYKAAQACIFNLINQTTTVWKHNYIFTTNFTHQTHR